MSYLEPYATGEEEFDPFADPTLGPLMSMAGGDPMQAALLAILLNQDPAYAGANMPTFEMGQMQSMANMVPEFQPSGDPLTVAQQNTAFNAQRNAMFDTGFMGFGGMDAFAADAFDSTVTTSIRQDPALQQVYGFLRSPTSMEGIIAQEIMSGGTPMTAQRRLREIFSEPDEAVAAIFAVYDQQLNRAEPSVTAADVAGIRENLLLELPKLGGFDGTIPEQTLENVNWDQGEFSVAGRAGSIYELQAEVPRLGPSRPQWDPATGQQISAGGELQWGQDETGAPVMIEVTETPSAAAKYFSDRGLPSPADEYEVSDFAPQAVEMQGVLATGAFDQPVDEAMARFLAGNQPSFNPVTPASRAAAAAMAPTPGQPGQISPPVEDYRDPTSAYVVPPIDVTGPIPSSLEDAIRNGTDTAWMQENWENIPELQRTNVREVLASYGLSPQLYGIEVRESESHPGAVEDIGSLATNQTSGLPTSDAGFVAGEAATQLENALTQPQGAETWLAGNYARLDPVEQGEVRGVLANHGLTVEDLLPAGGAPVDGAGVGIHGTTVRIPVAPRLGGKSGGRRPVETGGEPPPPGGGLLSDAQDFVANGPPTPPSYGGRQEYELATQQQPTPPYTYSGGYTPPRDVQREAAMASAMVRAAAAAPGNLGGQNPWDTVPSNTLTSLQGPLTHDIRGEAGLHYVYGPGGGPLPQIETGERQASGTGWYGDDVEAPGRRPMWQLGNEDRATQLEQGGITRHRRRRDLDQWHAALGQRNQAMQQAFGPEAGQAAAQVMRMREAGVRPLDQALMARRLVLMSAGMPANNYIPGT